MKHLGDLPGSTRADALPEPATQSPPPVTIPIAWIDAEDQLPNTGEDVLVCRRGFPDSVHKSRLCEQYTFSQTTRVDGNYRQPTREIRRTWHNGYHGFAIEKSYWSPLPRVPLLTVEEKAEQNELVEMQMRAFQRAYAQGIVTGGQDPQGLGEREARVEPGPKDAPDIGVIPVTTVKGETL